MILCKHTMRNADGANLLGGLDRELCTEYRFTLLQPSLGVLAEKSSGHNFILKLLLGTSLIQDN